MRQTLLLSMAISVGLFSTAVAQPDLKHFKSVVPDVTVEAVVPSPIEGIYEVKLKETPYPIYLSSDGKYMLEGQAIDLVNRTNITELHLNAQNKELLAVQDEADMIIYKAPNEKHVVTIFTDVDCPYCQLLHKEMNKYHQEGITVRYLAFPRMGINSPGYEDLVSVWCADDKQKAMDDAKLKEEINGESCGSNPVASQYHLGMKMGVNGTPAIITEEGKLIGGYVPAKELARMLDLK